MTSTPQNSLSGETPQVTLLGATPGTLRSMLAALTPEQMTWKPPLEKKPRRQRDGRGKPSPERWSVSEVIAHMLDVERRNLRLRAQLVANEDDPTFTDYDQNAEYARGAYSGREGREVFEEFCREREASLAWLESLPLQSWQRTGRHHEVGEIRLANIINLWAFHDLGHIRQIAELVRAQVCWDGMGPMQRYYSVNP